MSEPPATFALVSKRTPFPAVWAGLRAATRYVCAPWQVVRYVTWSPQLGCSAVVSLVRGGLGAWL